VKKKVAITGGAGFIGSNLAASLIADGHEVTIVDDLSTGLKSNIDQKNCKFIEMSITDGEKLKHELKSSEVIFHLGARGSVPRSIKNPVATHEVNATGTLNVLEAARENGAHVLFSSSSSVYGRNLNLPKDEKMWLGPLTPYAASKLSAESYVEAYGAAYALPVTTLRFFNVFGPRQRPDHAYAAVIPKWIWLAMNNQPLEIYGDGTQSRDFTYVKTVVDIAKSAMEQKILTEGAVNLAYGNRIFLTELVELLKEEFPNLNVKNIEVRKGDVKESQNSPELLKNLFPNIQPVKFKSALMETIQWLKEHGDLVTNGPSTID
jgi:UDP-glucose 4-epimerase